MDLVINETPMARRGDFVGEEMRKNMDTFKFKELSDGEPIKGRPMCLLSLLSSSESSLHLRIVL